MLCVCIRIKFQKFSKRIGRENVITPRGWNKNIEITQGQVKTSIDSFIININNKSDNSTDFMKSKNNEDADDVSGLKKWKKILKVQVIPYEKIGFIVLLFRITIFIYYI